MLTKKQFTCLMFIHEVLKKEGISPTFEDIRKHLGLMSKSGVHRLILNLEERGYIRRLPNRARAIEVLKMPQNVKNNKLPLQNSRISDEVRINDINLNQANHENQTSVTLDIMGYIAAGSPIEAISQPLDTISVPEYLVNDETHYALYVEGDSMEDAGILEGDVAIIKQANIADQDEIVVALVDNNEATLKKYVPREGNLIALVACSRYYVPQVYASERVTVQGVLKGIIRQYKTK